MNAATPTPLTRVVRPLLACVLGVAAAQAGEPELVSDINAVGGGVQALTAGSTQAIFTANSPDAGFEAWVSDGTLVGTRILRDIAPGRANASPVLSRTIGNRTWFAAATSQTGSEPWVTDGSGGGTVPLGDLFTGVSVAGDVNSSNATAFTDLGNGTVVFLAATQEGLALYRSDGSAGSAIKVKALSTNGYLVAYAANAGARLAGTNRAVFVADNKAFVTDGTVGGTSEIVLPSGASAPFRAISGCGGAFLYSYNETKFYWTDGSSAGTRLLDGGGTISLPEQVIGNRLVFAGGSSLRSTDGTQAGMLTLDTLNTSRQVTVANGFYWITSGGGALPSQVRRSDGTVAGTVLVSASGIYFNDVLSFVSVAGTTWFMGYQVINGKENRQVYRVDGDAATRVEVWANPVSTDPQAGLQFNATMVAVGQHLFIKDRGALLGFDTATSQTTVLYSGQYSSSSSAPAYLTRFKDGLLYWAVTSNENTPKPFFLRPDSGQGPTLLSNIRNPDGPGEPATQLSGNFFVLGDVALFAANNSKGFSFGFFNGMELWKTDGTTAGTGLLKDINPGQGNGLSKIVGFVPGSTTTAILVGNVTTTIGDVELLTSDGTAAGTVPLKDVNPGSDGCFPFHFTDMGTYWLFSATTGSNGREVWRTDGTAAGTVLVKDIRAGSADSINAYGAPVAWARIGSTAFFPASDGTNGIELWMTDGTAAGTVMVKDINPGAASSSPLDLCAYNGKVFFVATSAANGRELWVSDGTAAGTVMVKDINPGAASSITSPDWGYGFVTVSGGRLWFVADDGAHGRELWSSDGTAVSTALFRDIRPGTAGSDPYGLINVDGVLCFAADDGQTGVELWQTDGTQANTFLAGDINTGSGPSYPLYRDSTAYVNYQVVPDAVVRNGTLFFSARADSVGRELWRYTPARTTGAGGTIGFSSATITVSEAAGNAVISLVRSGGVGAATVNVQTVAGGTATAGTDFVATSGQVTFLTGETTKTVIVPILNDGVAESAETVLLTITGPTGGALLGQATATLIISDGGAANQAPTATAQTISTPKNTPRSITLAGSDPDGQAVTVAGVSAPTSGTLTGSGSVRTFTPATNATGTVTFTFTVTDGIAVSTPATVTITVTDTVNLAPTATAQSVSTALNTAVVITLSGSDPEGSALLLNSTTSPAHGQLIGSGQGLSRTYVPATGYTGSDSFTFTVSDGAAVSTPATVTIAVGANGNQSPVISQPAAGTTIVLP